MSEVEKVYEVTEPRSQLAAVIQMVERVAMNPDADMAKLEKMLDMQERILDREARMAFDAALAQMQTELPAVEKLAEGHNSKYAKFEHVLSAIKPSLQKHGFSITHRVKVEGGAVLVTAILGHKAGHREETTLALPPDTSGSKSAVQAIGSSTEYGRRYTMNTLLGIATKDADKDGGKPVESITTNQVANLVALAQEVGADMPRFLKFLKVESLADLRSDYYDRAVKALEEKRK